MGLCAGYVVLGVVVVAIVLGIFVIDFLWSSSKEKAETEKPRVFIDDLIVQLPDGVIVRIIGLSDWDYSVVVRVSGCVNKSYIVSFKGLGMESVTVKIPQEKLLHGCVLEVEVFYGDELLVSKEFHVGIIR